MIWPKTVDDASMLDDSIRTLWAIECQVARATWALPQGLSMFYAVQVDTITGLEAISAIDSAEPQTLRHSVIFKMVFP